MLRQPLILFVLLANLCSATFCLAKDNDKGRDRYLQARSIHLDKAGKKWAEKTLRKMSAEEKVGQLFSISVRVQFFNEADPIFMQMRDSIRKYHVGSLVIECTGGWSGVASKPALRSSRIAEPVCRNRRSCRCWSRPILSAAFPCAQRDYCLSPTRWPLQRRVTQKMPKPLAVSVPSRRAPSGYIGFFPDADVNSNPANPVINIRSFGEDPKQVSDFVASYIKGAHEGACL